MGIRRIKGSLRAASLVDLNPGGGTVAEKHRLHTTAKAAATAISATNFAVASVYTEAAEKSAATAKLLAYNPMQPSRFRGISRNNKSLEQKQLLSDQYKNQLFAAKNSENAEVADLKTDITSQTPTTNDLDSQKYENTPLV